MCRACHGFLQLFKGCLVKCRSLLFEVCFENIGERCRYRLEAFKKLMIKPTETSETPNFMDFGWSGPPSDGLNLPEVHVHPVLVNYIPKKGNWRLEYGPLVDAKEQIVFLQHLMYQVQVLMLIATLHYCFTTHKFYLQVYTGENLRTPRCNLE